MNLTEEQVTESLVSQLTEAVFRDSDKLKSRWELNSMLTAIIAMVYGPWPADVYHNDRKYYKTEQPCHNMKTGKVGMFYDCPEGKIARYTDGTISED